LGFLWNLFRIYSIQAKFHSQNIQEEQSSEDMLLTWVREITAGYEGVNIDRWGSSFRDGLAFLAMIDQYSKRFLNGPLYDYNDRAENYSTIQNVTDCLEVAERNINIPKLIEADPLISGDLEDRGLVL